MQRYLDDAINGLYVLIVIGLLGGVLALAIDNAMRIGFWLAHGGGR